MVIVIDLIPQESQRYETVGDWYYNSDGHLVVKATLFPKNLEYSKLIALHEVVEALICDMQGVTDEEVDEFDFNWDGEGEPGDDLAAPYHRAHAIASSVEMSTARSLGVDWSPYEAAIDEILQGPGDPGDQRAGAGAGESPGGAAEGPE